MSGFEALLLGRELGNRYRVEEFIGRGAMGAVYRATDNRLGRTVAAKVISIAAPKDPGIRERLRARFRREASSAARMPPHPNTVVLFDYGTDESLGLDYIVMEFLRGESLRERIARREVTALPTALRILRDIARGLAVGHRHGLVHRDVKPANIFLEGDSAQPIVRVLDFGIVKVLEEGDEADTHTRLTLSGEWLGTEVYASPEHLRGEAVTRASDVYSLGIVAFELLSGTRPFTEQDQIRRRAGFPVPVPSLIARNPAVTPAVEGIIRRALADVPEARFNDAGAFAAELHRVLKAIVNSTRAASAGEEEGFGVALGFRVFEADGGIYMAEAEISSYVDDPNSLGATLVFHALDNLDPTAAPDEDEEDNGWRIDIDEELTRTEGSPTREQFHSILRQLAGLSEADLRAYLKQAREETPAPEGQGEE